MIKQLLFKLLAIFCMVIWIVLFPIIEIVLKLTGRSEGITTDLGDMWHFVGIIWKGY